MQDPSTVYGKPGNPAIAFRLSTPVAYVSSTESVFADPFFRAFGVGGTSAVNDTRFYNYSGDYLTGRIFDPAQDAQPAFGLDAIIFDERNHFHLRGRGPDNDYESRSTGGWADYLKFHGAAGTGAALDGGIHTLYDPTNGTASSGDLVRFGSDGVKN